MGKINLPPDIRQTSEYAKYLESTGWSVIVKNGTYCYLRKIPILGFAIKVQRPERIDIASIEKILMKYKPFKISIEPNIGANPEQLTTLGFRVAKPYLPSKTIILDLSQSKNQIFAQLKNDAKKEIKRNSGRKLIFCKADSMKDFRSKWFASVGLGRYIQSLSHLTNLKTIFGQNALFVLDTTTNSGALFLLSGKRAYYWAAFTDRKGRSQGAQYKIVWEGILWAKKKGAMIFDFEGIYDSRFPDKSWLGFTHFKKAFGGVEIEYPPTLERHLLFPPIF